jgi:presqualene diphosphate synthase
VTAAARFAEAADLVRGMRRRPLKAARVILVVYRRLLQRLREHGFAPSGEPVKLSKAEKLWLVLRHGIL